jgi:hypothetical protein
MLLAERQQQQGMPREQLLKFLYAHSIYNKQISITVYASML